MPYPIDQKLVVAVSSTALFDLQEADIVYRTAGLDAFLEYQEQNRSNPPAAGAAFPFIQRLLGLNEIYSEEQPVEVVILSRNHPKASLRVMDAVEHYGLNITRASFTAGDPPYPYMQATKAVLYLSTDREEVREAVENGYPAGHVLPHSAIPDDDDKQLRIAFDFDGVIVDDEAEKVYADGDLPLFHHHEKLKREQPLNSGPMFPLLKKISDLQKLEATKPYGTNNPEKHVRVAILTARNAPAHERLITTLENYDIQTDELFLTGGIEKKNYLDILKPQIFFDDQLGHLEPASKDTPCVHVPFGVRNV
ncbi:5'-nucleotidase [Terasakiella sp. A23]|uniref:5'-nucleotidase n=1 Tax=Terasakiella sp. FCG-A23 TaxID=3080561 RepID=UPI002952BF3D|nr:5'-nucleotidase [Terasakiella sp. A23]MDV7339967.1 5'-nucleotidase [Terasakiella sp. A23]